MEDGKQKGTGKRIMPKEEVGIFLNSVRACLKDESRWKINNEPRAGGRVNKTRLYMAERNISYEDVAAVINELDVSNYSYTDNDYDNLNFPNEDFWFFGITKEIVDLETKLYVKLKIRRLNNVELLLVMSFHPEQPYGKNDELKFPYKEEV